MAIALTLLVALTLCAFVAVKALRANRRVAAGKKAREAALLAREEAERECRRRVGEAKGADAVAAAAKAVGKDPERAARVVGGMLRRKK